MTYSILLLSLFTLSHCLPLSQLSPKLSLPPGCSDFTVGSCSPEVDELIDVYDQIPTAAMCQIICELQEGCNYFSHSISTSSCALFHYRFLSSCQVIGGPVRPSIDECWDTVDTVPSCDSFVRETCVTKGEVVLNKTSITDAHACQQLLQTIGFIYQAEYFVFDSVNQICTFYDSTELECDSLSGPATPALQSCNVEVTTTAGTTTTSAPTTIVPTTAAPGTAA